MLPRTGNRAWRKGLQRAPYGLPEGHTPPNGKEDFSSAARNSGMGLPGTITPLIFDVGYLKSGMICRIYFDRCKASFNTDKIYQAP